MRRKAFPCSFIEYGVNEDKLEKTIRLPVNSFNNFKAKRFSRVPRFTMCFKTIQFNKTSNEQLLYPDFSSTETLNEKMTKASEGRKRQSVPKKEVAISINVPRIIIQQKNKGSELKHHKKHKPIILKLNNAINRSLVVFDEEHKANTRVSEEDNEYGKSYYDDINELKEYEKRLHRINNLLNIDRSRYKITIPSRKLIKRQNANTKQRFFDTDAVFNLHKAFPEGKSKILY